MEQPGHIQHLQCSSPLQLNDSQQPCVLGATSTPSPTPWHEQLGRPTPFACLGFEVVWDHQAQAPSQAGSTLVCPQPVQKVAQNRIGAGHSSAGWTTDIAFFSQATHYRAGDFQGPE